MKTKTIKKAFIFIILFFFYLHTNSYSGGDWIGEWATNTSAKARHFKTNQRSYYSGGSASIRYPAFNNSNIVAFSSPSISMGCGGIDFFGGNMSFLSGDEFLKKLQNIVTSGFGAFVYNTAIKTLSESIASTMNTIESITNDINQLALNDCQAGKNLYATIEEKGVGGMAQDIGSKMKEFKSKVTGDAPQEVNRNLDNKSTDEVLSTIDSTKNCPTLIQDIFKKDGSFLEILYTAYGGNKKGIPLLRSLIGDFIQKQNGGNIEKQINSCTDWTGTQYISRYIENNYSLNSSNSCTKQSSFLLQGTSANDLKDWVNIVLKSIVKKIQEKKDKFQNFTNAERFFIALYSKYNLYNTIYFSALQSGDDEIPTRYIETYAYLFGELLLKENLKSFIKITDETKNIALSSEKSSGSSTDICFIQDVYKANLTQIKILKENAENILEEINNERNTNNIYAELKTIEQSTKEYAGKVTTKNREKRASQSKR